MNKVKVLDFYADWCGPCKMMAPTISHLEKEMPDVTFEKVNVDAQQDLAQMFGVMAIPTLVFFADGEEKARVSGFATKEKILKEIAKLVD